MPAPVIDRPIFIVGMPRSGTSIFYETLGAHPDLASVTHATKKFPTSLPLTRLVAALRPDARPTEGHGLWAVDAGRDDDVLEASDLTDERRRHYRKLVQTHLAFSGRPRFLAKHPANVLRMGYYDAIFPDAIFVHLVRDGRAVARSILVFRDRSGDRSTWWGHKVPGWRALGELDPCEGMGRQWRATLELARATAAGRGLGPGRYHEIRYEDFCAAPRRTLVKLGEACGLTWPEDALAAATADVDSRNDKWPESLGPDEIRALEAGMGPLMTELGYEPARPRQADEQRRDAPLPSSGPAWSGGPP